MEIKCDAKHCARKNFEVFYCEDCYLALELSLEETTERIKELEKQVDDLTQEVEHLR